jgi:hypothetical protein
MTPDLETRYLVPRRVLSDTRELLAPSSRARVEGVVVWWGRMNPGNVAEVVIAYRPGQVAHRTSFGLTVEVPQEAISEMIAALPAGVIVVARLHTHGEEAYHSPMDDRNFLIAHEGAISIVIPYFAASEIDLAECSVNILEHGRGWRELSPEEVNEQFEVVDD